MSQYSKKRGISLPLCFAECVIARYLAICGRDANWRMERADMGYTSGVQLCEIGEVCEQPAHTLAQ